jgi:hypothetical protein
MLLSLAALLALSAAVPALAGPTPAPDNSLTVKEYVDAGVPPIDKAWGPEDYAKAATALEAIIKGDSTKLPRYKSKNSGEMFAHIVAQKNLDVYGDKTVSVDMRAQKAGLLGDYVPMFALYGNAIKPEHTFDSEALELGGFVLRAELEAARVVDEFKTAHGMKEDNAGFKQARAGFAQTIGGVFEVMMDHASIRTSETTRFVGELKEFLPKLVAELTPEAQQQFKAKLKEYAGNEADKELKEALTGLLAGL